MEKMPVNKVEATNKTGEAVVQRQETSSEEETISVHIDANRSIGELIETVRELYNTHGFVMTGSNGHEYKGQDIVAAIEMVRDHGAAHPDLIERITRKYGLREKVIEILSRTESQ